MKILDNIEIIDLSLYLRKEKTLVIADVHIGYEEALSKQGVLMPKFQFKETKERIDKILKRVKVEKIIVNGDFKHEFGSISDSEWREALQLLDFLMENKEIILIKGNHDNVIEPIADKRGLDILKGYDINDVYFCHGDFIPEDEDFKRAKVIVIGHEHSAVSIGTKIRKEIYKCFLKGRWEDKILIVMPSFNLVTEGTDVLKEKLLSPFLKQNLDKFNVYVIQDKIYDFGKLGKLD